MGSLNSLAQFIWVTKACLWISKFDLSQYKFQLVPFYNDEKEKVIWVNGICIQDLFDYGEEEKSWRETVLIVNDGGKCHFNIYVNLKRSKAFDLVINGEA